MNYGLFGYMTVFIESPGTEKGLQRTVGFFTARRARKVSKQAFAPDTLAYQYCIQEQPADAYNTGENER